MHSKNPESEYQKPNSEASKFVHNLFENHLPSQIKNPSQQLISSGAKKKGKPKNPSQASSSSLPLLFTSLCSCRNDPMFSYQTRPLRFTNTPTPFHKHAHSGLPIKGETFSHKIHLYHFSQNQRARQQTTSDDVDLCPQLVMTSTYSHF